MKRFIILLLMLLPLAGCQQAEDTRYFAPELSFGAEAYAAAVADGGIDVVIAFSRPALLDFQIGLVVTSSLQEGVQYTLSAHTLDVAAGDTEARLHITLVDDEIWDRESYIDLLLTPGEHYTIDPDKCCATRVNVSKDVVLPILGISVEGDAQINPYRPTPVTLKIVADNAPVADVDVQLSLEGLTAGVDYLIDGEAVSSVILPAGKTSLSFEFTVPQKDLCGYDVTVPVTLIAQKGKYVVGSEGASADIRLYDPVPDFSKLFKTGAQAGDGYQLRQAIKTPAGEWEGNLAANVDVSAQGSAYIRSLRNMGTSLGPLSNEVGLHILRLCDFFPNLRGASGEAILDYGRNNNTRGFSPVDSLFRFVLDPGSATQGDLVLNKPRTFTAFTGDYAQWKDAWENDSKATNGNIFASTSAIITSRIHVVLEKVEGRFDLGNSTEMLLFTAWFSCDSNEFMNGVQDKYAVTQDTGLWKVEYKIWPR